MVTLFYSERVIALYELFVKTLLGDMTHETFSVFRLAQRPCSWRQLPLDPPRKVSIRKRPLGRPRGYATLSPVSVIRITISAKCIGFLRCEALQIRSPCRLLQDRHDHGPLSVLP